MGSIESKDNRTCFARKSYLTVLTEPVKLRQRDVTLGADYILVINNVFHRGSNCFSNEVLTKVSKETCNHL